MMKLNITILQMTVTGPDILFFWVPEWLLQVMSLKKNLSNVYLTGLVRDKQRRKMSKSWELSRCLKIN